ncbi:MAG: hypothetical protein ABI746_06935 [Dermatophilaceae bacterium]
MNTAQTTVVRDAPPWMERAADLAGRDGRAGWARLRPMGHADVPTALREAADAALLDEGVDEIVAHVAGRADEALARLVSLVSDLAGDAPALARAVAEQRLAIELLARGRRTPSNERLLRALRRGRILGALATIDPWSPVVAVVDEDGTWALTGRVDISADLPAGSALLVPVRSSDGRRALVWIGVGDVGVTHLPVQSRPFGARSRALLLDGVRVRVDELVTDETGTLLADLASAQARLDAALTLADFIAAGEAFLAMREFAASQDEELVTGA